MSQYTKSTNFATKDNLSPGDPLKIVRGTEIDTEFNNISTAISTKTDNSAAAITGGSISGITDLAIADGGTGASTATAAINNLLPSQTSNANKYLQTDGTNVSWDAVSLSTSDITGTLPVANGGTGVTSSTGTGSVVLSNSPTLVTPALGTPASGVATNLTGLPISTGVSGLGTGVATFLGTPSSANLASAVSDETGSGALVFANSPTLVTPALGTPSALVGTNITGTASGLTAGNVTTNANLTGAVTSVGNATSLGSFSSANLLGALTDETGTGSAVFATSPTLVTPILGTPTSATLTNATGLPIATGVSGLGTGVATALAVNVGSAGAPVVNGGALGTPSSGTVTNLTGTASININGTVGATTPTTGAFTTLSASSTVTLSGGTANGVTYLNGSKVLTSGSALTFDGTNLGLNCTATNFGANYRTIEAKGASTTTSGIFRASSSDASQKIDLFIDGGVGVLRTDSNHPLAFSLNNAEQMRLTSTGLGIGTNGPNRKLYVQSDDSATGGNVVAVRNSNSTAGAFINFLAGGSNAPSMGAKGDDLVFTADGYNGTEWGRFSSGNLLVGGTSNALGARLLSENASGNQLALRYTSVATWYTSVDSSGNYIWTKDGGTIGRFDSSGNLLVGKTNSTGVNAGVVLTPTGGFTLTKTGTSASDQVIFYRGTAGSEVYVGTITTTGTATSYVTSSDYRLKNSVAPMTGALAKVALLKPCTYKWNADGSDGEGFIAHELAEVCPQAVVGEKDAVDENGNPKYQGIDTSFLVATITAALQELNAKFDAYVATHP